MKQHVIKKKAFSAFDELLINEYVKWGDTLHGIPVKQMISGLVLPHSGYWSSSSYWFVRLNFETYAEVPEFGSENSFD